VAVGGQLVGEHREDVDLADAGIGLGGADRDPPPGEVDVAPAQRRALADPQAGEDESGDQGPAARGTRRRRGVELGRGVEQRDDLLGAVEIDRPGAPGLELAVARVDADRVAGDEVTLLSDRKDLPEAGDGLVDGLDRQRILTDLERRD
jgi:hypothetical protein